MEPTGQDIPFRRGIRFMFEAEEFTSQKLFYASVLRLVKFGTRQTKKDQYHVILLIWGSENKQIQRDRKQNGIYQGLGQGDTKSVKM